MVNDFERYCARCDAVATCKRMFGRFWQFKSTNGTGCQHPVRMEIEDELPPPPKMPTRPTPMKAPMRPVRVTQQDFFNTKGTR